MPTYIVIHGSVKLSRDDIKKVGDSLEMTEAEAKAIDPDAVMFKPVDSKPNKKALDPEPPKAPEKSEPPAKVLVDVAAKSEHGHSHHKHK